MGWKGKCWRVCVYDSARQGYTLTRYPAAGNETAGQLAQAALDALYPQGEGIALNGIRVERGFAVVDLTLTPDSPAAQALTDGEAVTALLNSLAAPSGKTASIQWDSPWMGRASRWAA